jgi:hypothetical protein
LVTPLLAHIAGIPIEESIAQLGIVCVGALGTAILSVKARICGGRPGSGPLNHEPMGKGEKVGPPQPPAGPIQDTHEGHRRGGPTEPVATMPGAIARG